MTDKTEKTAEPKAPKTPKEPKRGIGTVIKEAILAGKTNEEALAAALAEFPTASTTASTVSWYRNQLRKEGHAEVPTARGLKKAAADAAEAAKSTAADKDKVGETADPLA